MSSADPLRVPLEPPGGRAPFELVLPWPLAGDQPQAAAALSAGLARGEKFQTLKGVTGSGKTVTMAQVIADAGRPALILAHNKTLAAQLYGEFREFFPKNSIEYFVSYYDYYQPEAYVARSDTYIEKDSSRNEEIDKMRHGATRALFERRDVIIVASISCIYGLGAPVDYGSVTVRLAKGERMRRDTVLRHLVDIQYERNDQNFVRGKFRVRGDTLEVHPAYEDLAVRVEFFGDTVERITELDPLTGEVLAERDRVDIYPRASLRDTAGEAVRGDRRYRGRAGRPGEGAERPRPAPRGAAPAPADELRPRDAPRDRHLRRGRELLPPSRPPARREPPLDAPRLFSARLPHVRRRIRTSRSRRPGACTPAIRPARTSSSSTASGCRARWITVR